MTSVKRQSDSVNSRTGKNIYKTAMLKNVCKFRYHTECIPRNASKALANSEMMHKVTVGTLKMFKRLSLQKLVAYRKVFASSATKLNPVLG
jgi:hypothetical protein